MVAEKGKKSKPPVKVDDDDADHIDVELVQYIEKLQEVQDELEKVTSFAPSFLFSLPTWMPIAFTLCMHFLRITLN